MQEAAAVVVVEESGVVQRVQRWSSVRRWTRVDLVVVVRRAFGAMSVV